jgi:hypothetical protein
MYAGFFRANWYYSIDAEECKMLIGVGTDGASANIACAGLKGLVEKEIPCWCLAHRLELAVKDALKVPLLT